MSQLLGKKQTSAEDRPTQQQEANAFEKMLRKEINLYLTEDAVDVDSDALLWWRTHSLRFPLLVPLARRYLCIPASSVLAEQVSQQVF